MQTQPVSTSPEAVAPTTTPTSEPPRLTLEESQRLLALLQRVEESSLDALSDQELDQLTTLQERQAARHAYEQAQHQARRAALEAERQRGQQHDAQYRARLLALDSQDATPTLDQFVRQLHVRYRPAARLDLHATPQQLHTLLLTAYQHIVQTRTGRPAQLDAAAQRILQDATRWLHQPAKPGLLLRGGVGVGKTTLMTAIQAVIQIQARQAMPIWEAPRIAALGSGADGTAILQRLTREPLLGIDDLGTEPLSVKNYGNDTLPLVELLTARYTQRLPTIITTNLTTITRDSQPTDEIADRYGLRIADRLHELCNTISYHPDQPSYRRQP